MSNVQKAICELNAGRMVLLTDDNDRENEGDLVMASEFVTQQHIVFMLKHTCGIICVAMSESLCDQFAIPPMVSSNQSNHQTPFGVSFEAASGITTGVSAHDRALGIRLTVDKTKTHRDIVMPGHLFPLRANPQGVFARRGHTEGSVDLMNLSGLSQSAVICEVTNADGSMAKGNDLTRFAAEHNLVTLSIQDIYEYRLRTESWLQLMASSHLPTKHGDFTLQVFRSQIDASEHIALVTNKKSNTPLIRLHSSCMTGDILGSIKCDCGLQLEKSLQLINEEGGALLYLSQEGRGIGLVNKIKAYHLQDHGRDTVEANHELGFSADCREYHMAVQMLKQLEMMQVRLLTNNPRKVDFLSKEGIEVTERVPLQLKPTASNRDYLKTKRDKLGHLLDMKELA